MSRLYKPLTKDLKAKLKLSSKDIVIKRHLKNGRVSVHGCPEPEFETYLIHDNSIGIYIYIIYIATCTCCININKNPIALS